MPRSFEIPLSGYDENITFVIGIKRHLFYPGHSLFVKAEIHLCPELQGCSCLSTDNRTDVGLADTDDPVRNRVHFIFVHVLLLLINLAYLFAGTFFTLGQVQVILSGIPAVHPWNVIIKSSAGVIDDSFQIFPCLIQKIYILRERDLLRGTGCIRNHCSAVLTRFIFNPAG